MKLNLDEDGTEAVKYFTSHSVKHVDGGMEINVSATVLQMAKKLSEAREALHEIQRRTDGVTDIGWAGLNEMRVLVAETLAGTSAPVAVPTGPKEELVAALLRLGEGAAAEAITENKPIAGAPVTSEYVAALEAKAALLDAPEIHDFAKAVVFEAAHQRSRWSTEHDGDKTDADWFWLIGYLAGKALHTATEDNDKLLHRIVTVAAAACNWHAAKLGKTVVPVKSVQQERLERLVGGPLQDDEPAPPLQLNAAFFAEMAEDDNEITANDCEHSNVGARPCDQTLAVFCKICNAHIAACWMEEHIPESLWNRACKNTSGYNPCELDRDNVCAICGEAVVVKELSL